MTPYNPNIHHRRSIRLKGYDYSRAGLYFVTLCCQDRACLFGEIRNGQHFLNDAGKIANGYWLEIPAHFPNAVLHEYIVMPNHVRGIIELVNEGVENQNRVENFQPQNEFQKIIPHSIGSIVRGFKIGVTKWFRQNTDVHTVWQRNYWEHIIRDDQAYQRISDYIINNPAKWADDKFYDK